ncbi:MAG: flagellar hook protein FlgE [Anaerolineales bacterium]|nr:flagellar hook protein FlgE [Anaerolineales bacterium]
MLRSMYTAISSLNLHQTYLDVVANNIANVNTYSFKSSSVNFQNQFAQTLWSGASPSGELGGVNPAQVGLGVQLGSITPDFTQGTLTSTGVSNDLAIQGEGFFVFYDGENYLYSRDGALEIDADGYLVNGATGFRIQGWLATGTGATATVEPSGATSSISFPLDTALASETTYVNLGGNLDAETADGETYDATVGVYDSQGVLHSITITFTNSATDNQWTWAASGDGASQTGTLVFDADGQYVSGSGTITVTDTGGADNVVFDIDFANMTQLATDNEVAVTASDGLEAGTFSGFYQTPSNGEIYGVYSNGMTQLIGQLAIASFTNPPGLSVVGQNMYEISPNSGDPNVGAAGTGGRGTIASGYLEGSNVDLGQEFTNMILAERGFQAASRIITTSDEMLQELVNLKR